jgi:hypothetical protein
MLLADLCRRPVRRHWTTVLFRLAMAVLSAVTVIPRVRFVMLIRHF